MSKPFKITFKRSEYSKRSRISVLDIKSAEASSLTSIGVSFITYCDLEDHWLIERSAKSDPEHIDFFFADHGEFIIETESGKQRVHAGDVAIVPSWIDRRLSINKGTSRHLYLRIDDVQKYPQIKKVEIRKSSCVDELIYYTKHIQQTQGASFDSAEYRSHLFAMIQLLLRHEIWYNQDEKFYKLDNLFQILNTESRQYKVSTLAKRLGVSISSFYKICMEHYGKSPSRIIQEINMRKAVNLLRSTELSLENISDHLGYANLFAFSKAFKKIMNISPSQYRKKYKG